MAIGSIQISGVNNPLEAAKWGKTPLIQKKAAAASKNAMTDDYVEKLQELARKDAQKGVYMDTEAMQLSHSEFLDRLLGHNASKVKRDSGNTITASVSGLAGGCSADLSSGPMHQGAIIYSPDGEMIASYNSDGGWQSLTTQAENRFLIDSNTVYKQAYDAVRAEIKAAQQRPVTEAVSEATFDIRA